MSHEKGAKLNHYMAFLRVAVDGYEAGRISGSVYSRRLKAPLHFATTKDLLLQIEDLLDTQDFPRAFQRKRTFAEGKAPKAPGRPVAPEEDGRENMDAETVDMARGKISTFTLNVITRQNTSWQGYLDWLDGADRLAFNSDLELLSMISERLELSGG
ncbi:MAG: hypothetical protein FWG28_02145 [Clostridiales bacterium]|nr:hypothetical protein [Clostridiales bacterium]